MKKETIIISLGGSLVVPDEIDEVFLKELKELILSHIKSGKRFIIIIGGGRICRKYQSAAKDLSCADDENLDWLGIAATKLNAELVRIIFSEVAHPKVISDPTKRIAFKRAVLVASGWKPGFSTDYDAVLLAKQFQVKRIINLTNIDYAYEKDPKLFPDAKRIAEISWKDFRKIVGEKWSPGLNVPFDPVASRECEKNRMIVYIANGKNIANISKIISGEKAEGTVIS